jgi:hypothetical protein
MDPISSWSIISITVWAHRQKSRENCAKLTSLSPIFITWRPTRPKMSLSTRRRRRRTTGMTASGAKTMALSKHKISRQLILKVQGAVTNSSEGLEMTIKTTKLGRGGLEIPTTNSLMATSPILRGPLQIQRQRKYLPSTRMILPFIGLFRLLLLSNQIWTSWWAAQTLIRQLLHHLA